MVIGLVVVVALIGGAVVFVVGGDDDVALAWGFEEGQTYRYRMRMTFDGQVSAPELGLDQPLNMGMDATVSWRVKEVDEAGVATIELTMEDVSGTVNGMPSPQQAEDVETSFRMAPDGRVLTAGELSFASSTNGEVIPGFDQVSAILPDQEVSPGDTWNKEFSQAFPFGEGELRYSSQSRFDRYEDRGGVRTAVITSNMTSPLEFTLEFRRLLETLGQTLQDAGLPPGSNPKIVYGGNATVNATSWLDLEARQLVQGRNSSSFDMTMRFEGFPAGEIPPGSEVAFSGTASARIDRI
jgi:hypothetical protein